MAGVLLWGPAETAGAGGLCGDNAVRAIAESLVEAGRGSTKACEQVGEELGGKGKVKFALEPGRNA